MATEWAARFKNAVGLATVLACSACGDNPVGPSYPDVTGAYSLTIIPSSTCQAEVRDGTYATPELLPVRVTQNGAQITGTTGAACCQVAPTVSSADVSGRLIGTTTATVSIRFDWSNSHVAVRRVAGSGRATVTPTTISGTFEGSVATAYVFGSFSTPLETCNAIDHEFALKRVGP